MVMIMNNKRTIRIQFLIIVLFLTLVPFCFSQDENDWSKFRGSISNNGYREGTVPPQLSLIWSFSTENFIYGSTAVVDGRVYIGSYDNNVYCLDADTGDKIWSYATKASIHSSPAVYEEKV